VAGILFQPAFGALLLWVAVMAQIPDIITVAMPYIN
jgi:hypothetical protein